MTTRLCHPRFATKTDAWVLVSSESLIQFRAHTLSQMKFDTQIWHPNISSQSGAICLDILKNEWSPALTIRTALISLQALLSAAEPDDPQDAVVAKMYKEDRPQFDQQAKYWTEMYAKGLRTQHVMNLLHLRT